LAVYSALAVLENGVRNSSLPAVPVNVDIYDTSAISILGIKRLPLIILIVESECSISKTMIHSLEIFPLEIEIARE
jgi:hypothetical protein